MGATLIPSVEKRISAWKDLQQRKQEQQMAGDKPKLSITISREFGCEGYPLAMALKEKLDAKTEQTWTIFDDQLVDKINSELDISKYLVKSVGDRAKYLDYIIASLLPTWKSEATIYKKIVEAIVSVAHEGNAIIIGRGAFAVTRNMPNCFHFRLVAPFQYRIDSYSRRKGITREEAEKIITEKEKKRNSFINDFLDCQYEEENFHLVINNSKFPVERIADMIIDVLDI